MLTAAEIEQIRQRTAKLSRLRDYGTRYEAVVTRQDGVKRLVAYSSRKSRRGLLAAAQHRGEAIIKFLGIGEQDRMTFVDGGLSIGGASICWSGRTQRDAIMTGELEYIGEAPIT